MINEVIISRLDEIIGDYNTPFFNYLLYSYDLSLNECEVIINDLKDDISSNKILSDNIVLTLENYFRKKIIKNRKDKKILYLTDLIDESGEFYSKYLKKYDLSKDDISLIYEKVKERILDDDLDWFEIERYVEYYFSNSLKQVSYINDLNSIVGRNYDTLIIRNAKVKYPILNENDIVQIIFNIHGDIIDANDFPSPIKDEFLKRCMHKSEAKKQYLLIFIFAEVLFQPLDIKFHIVIQCIYLLSTKYRKAKNSSSTSREHISILHHIAAVQNNHRNALVAKQ